MEVTASTEATSVSTTDASAWWRLWGIAAFAHVVANTGVEAWEWRNVANGITGLIAIAIVASPADRRLRIALPVAILASAWTEAPFLGNHWWVAAAVSAAALVAGPWRTDWWPRFAPSGRLILLAFYSFAAFAKLNTGFFDPVASCARHFTNRTLELYQLPEVSGSSPIAEVLPWIVAGIELSVPLLLVFRPRYGVWLAVAFHLLLTLDLRQHFFDFTMMLIPLFLLFAAAGTLTAVDRRLPRFGERGQAALFGVAVAILVLTTTPVPAAMRGLALIVVFAMWFVLAVLLALTILAPSTLRAEGHKVVLRPASLGAAVVVAVVVFNGMTPYLELKTAAGFNMYANLVTADGDTNHFVITATAHMRDVQSDVVRIIATDDDGLDEYIDSGFLLPVVNLRDYLADHPDATVTFERAGETITLSPASDQPEWLDRQPTVVEKLAFFRAVAIDDPPECQPKFLPAR